MASTSQSGARTGRSVAWAEDVDPGGSMGKLEGLGVRTALLCGNGALVGTHLAALGVGQGDDQGDMALERGREALVGALPGGQAAVGFVQIRGLVCRRSGA